ncbi:transaldolase [Lapillicoccus sp.]|uniref:transaldolase n=1 Tax=Lapillicoccus sp. TaxID=1909287 RepID=UPI0032678CFB
MNPTQHLYQAGQSLWLDSINRTMLRDGTLSGYIDHLALTGLTSNPTILGRAMAAGTDYDESLRAHLAGGTREPEELVYSVALDDITAAADLFRPVWDRTVGVDGYVSIEVPPGLAYDTDRSIEVARRLHQQAGRPNVLVKIPGTPSGLVAMEHLVAEGIGINVTLLFSAEHYQRTAEAYIRALERRACDGLSLDVPCVASVFVSRWDQAVDRLLPQDLHGRLGLAVAQNVYASYRSLLAEQRWTTLAAAGARPQRVLWASTSTKDPKLPDTYYVDELAAPDTINTMPEQTLLAYADHGGPVRLMKPDDATAERCMATVTSHGIDIDALGQALQRRGARAFEADWATLLAAISVKINSLARGHLDPVGSAVSGGRSSNVR